MAHNKLTTANGQKITLRRYSNRRYYDASRRQHVTLEEIFELVRTGNDIEVTDSTSGEDITTKVLTQIILEHDAPKLDVFPAELLHQLIRANEPLVHEFVEKYFSQAFAAFLDSQKRFGQYMREALGLSVPPAASWPVGAWGPFAQSLFADRATPPREAGSAEEGPGEEDDLRRSVEQLQSQLRQLQEKIEDR